MYRTTSIVWALLLLSIGGIDLCAAQCTLPEQLEHGQYIYESANPPNEVSNGYVIRVICDEGSRMRPEGDGFMTCSSGDWSPSSYECRTGCEPLPPFPYGTITYRTVGNREVARYSCTTPGYRLLGEERKRRCQEDLTWSGTAPRCRPIPTCPVIELPPGVQSTRVNGRFREGLWTIGSTHSFTCGDSGHYMDLPTGTFPAIKCLRTGWNATVPTCTAPTCAPILDEIENGRTTAENRTYNLGESIEFICNPGYRTTSPSWRVCTADGLEGVWEGVTPSCEVTTCPALQQIEHGTTISDSNQVGGNGTFRCRSGYTLIGDERLTCLSTGQWNGTVPVCEDEGSAYCPTLGTPLNGRKNGDTYLKFSRVSFECNPGYTLIGSGQRQCQPDGQWDGESARCMGPKDFHDVNEIAATLGQSIDGLKETALQENVIDPASLGRNSSRGRFIPLTHDYGVDLYFMFDSSRSVGVENFEKAKKFAKELVKEIGVNGSRNSLRVGAMYFSSSAHVAFHTVDYDNTEDVVNALNGIPYLGGGTNIAAALALVQDVMVPQSAFREKSFRTAFLITDGEATEGGSPGPVGQRLKADGIKMHCLGVSEAASKVQLRDIASDPKKEYLFFLKNYDSLGNLVKAVTNQTIDYSECGVSKSSGSFAGGAEETPAAEGAWPWQVYLEIYESAARVSGIFHVCGGTLLRNDTIMTAAHCVYNFATLDVAVGVTNRHAETPGSRMRGYLEPSDVTLHENYNNRTYSHDIALIHLTDPFDLTPYVRPACLPDPAKEDRLLHRGIAIMSGWGHDEPYAPNVNPDNIRSVDHLHQLPLPLKTRDDCEETLEDHDEEEWFDETMTCAGYENKKLGACKGDSGGPLVKYANKGGRRCWTVIGISSWGRGCAWPGELDFFTNVPHHVEWIERKMEAVAPAK